MAKSKDRSEVEHLRGLVRELKSELRHLKKTMARKQKREHLLEDVESREAELFLQEEMEEKKTVAQTERCPKCKSKIDVIDGAKLKVYICSDCGYRKSSRV